LNQLRKSAYIFEGMLTFYVRDKVDWWLIQNGSETTFGVGDVSANIMTSSRMMYLLNLIDCLPFSLHFWKIINTIRGSLSNDDHTVIGY